VSDLSEKLYLSFQNMVPENVTCLRCKRAGCPHIRRDLHELREKLTPPATDYDEAYEAAKARHPMNRKRRR
jgi:hypothetical protein